VYQLCDPHALTLNQMLRLIERTLNKRFIAPKLSRWSRPLVKAAVRYVPGLGRFTQLTPQQVDYLMLPTRHFCQHTTERLAQGGLVCPRFETYFPVLLRFMQAHPEVPSEGMR